MGKGTGEADADTLNPSGEPWLDEEEEPEPERSVGEEPAADDDGASTQPPTTAEAHDIPAEEHGDAATAGQPAPGSDQPAAEGARRKGRTSVPSWDDIMFGGGRGASSS